MYYSSLYKLNKILYLFLKKFLIYIIQSLNNSKFIIMIKVISITILNKFDNILVSYRLSIKFLILILIFKGSKSI